VYTDGSLGPLLNSGMIKGPNAINVTESGSLGEVTNSGTVAGNIVNASANDLSIGGGAGAVFGTLTGYSGGIGAGDIGTITNTASNVKFSSGNLLLNDHVNVGTGTVTNAATLQVDNPLNITGNYQQNTAGTLSVGVAGMDNHGKLTVSTAANVATGGSVALTRLEGFRFAAGEKFTLIDAPSATYNVAGMTASAAGFSGGYLLSDVTAGGHSDLVVCLTNLVTADCNGKVAYSVANTSNAVTANNAAGSYFGNNVALNKLANAVVALGSTAEANRAGNQLLAAPHHDAVMLAQQPSLDILNVVSGHADSTRLADNGGQSGVSAGESGRGLATWGEGFGGGSHQSQDGQFSGYSMSTDGLVAGADAAVGETNTRVGGVFTYSHSDLKEHGDRTGDTMGLNSYGVLGYASMLGNRAYADLIGGVLLDKFDTVRVINFPGFAGVAGGTHDGTQYVVKASGGYRFPMGTASGNTLTPVWGVSYSHLNQDGYTESGGNGGALTVSSSGDNSVKGEVGLKLEHSFPMASGDVVPELKILARHEFDNGAQLQTQSFAADEAATTFSTQNLRPVQNTGVLSTGVNLLGKDGVTVTLKYTAEVGSGYVSQGGSLRVRWAF
jgi:outer membrane autotransporter protein